MIKSKKCLSPHNQERINVDRIIVFSISVFIYIIAIILYTVYVTIFLPLLLDYDSFRFYKYSFKDSFWWFPYYSSYCYIIYTLILLDI